MESEYLKSKQRDLIRRTTTSSFFIQMLIRIILLASLFIGCKMSCDYFTDQAIKVQEAQ